MRKVRYYGRGISRRRVAEGKSPGGDAVAERYSFIDANWEQASRMLTGTEVWLHECTWAGL